MMYAHPCPQHAIHACNSINPTRDTAVNPPNHTQHLLASGSPEYQALISAIQSPTSTHLILNTLLCACHPMVTKWVIEVAQGIFRNEIIRSSDVRMGLHFKASQTCSAELTGLN